MHWLITSTPFVAMLVWLGITATLLERTRWRGHANEIAGYSSLAVMFAVAAVAWQ